MSGRFDVTITSHHDLAEHGAATGSVADITNHASDVPIDEILAQLRAHLDSGSRVTLEATPTKGGAP